MRECARKVRHQTRAGAKAMLRRMSGRRSTKGLCVYKCRFCAFFHVGNRTPFSDG